MSIHSAVTGRDHAIALLATVLFAFILLNSCASRDTSEVRAVVERFMIALFDGDRETISELAPDITDDKRLEQVFSALTNFSSWSITDVIRRGGSARARISLISDGRETIVVIPLRLKEHNWTVDSRISVTTELDFVPAQR